MDYLSHSPDQIIQHIISFLSEKDLGKLSSVSRLFNTVSTFYFSRLLTSFNHPSSSPISTFGSIFNQRVKIIESWNSDSPSIQYLPYNLVKSIKFGSDFFVVLQYDGQLFSNISGKPQLLETQAAEIEACMNGFIFRTFFGKVCWVKKIIGTIVSKEWDGEEPLVISASLYGVVALPSQKVVLFDDTYRREVNFGKENIGKVVQIKSTPKMLLILTEEMKLYLCGLITFEANLMISGHIRFISIGNTHSLVLLQEASSPFESWNTASLIKFMTENGFEDCCQLIKNHEIDGKDLQKTTDKYFMETLGIREPDRRSKLRYLLKESNSRSYLQNFSILGWGRNNFSQLGGKITLTNIPTKILSPTLPDNDMIHSIHCDKQFSCVLTKKGKILALGGKSNNKLTQAEKKNIVWEDVTGKICDKGLVVGLEMGNKMAGVVYRVENLNKEKVKMRMAGDIVKLAISGSFPIESYEVGYMDRFLGIMQMPLADFCNTDIPKHRIQYFKRNGKAVWDRQERIDNF